MTKQCTGLFVHSMPKLKTVEATSEKIVKKCEKCGYTETLPHSAHPVIFLNGILMQHKKWGADDNRRELLQPLQNNGEVNDDFTAAYGYNPFDERTQKNLPKAQGGDSV